MAQIIKCPNCGIYNTNKDYCSSCGTLLSYKKKRELAFAKEEAERKAREEAQREKSSSLYKKYKNHRFLIVRLIVKLIHGVWLIFMAIGMFLAWLVSAIAA